MCIRDRLAVLGRQIKVGVFDAGSLRDPVKICVEAVEQAKKEGYEVVIIDTAGRLHIDDLLMEELRKTKDKVNPSEILYVADAMTGQDAVNVGTKFNELIGIDGCLLYTSPSPRDGL